MGFILEGFFSDLILIFTTTFILVYSYFLYCYKYWERRNVPYITPTFPYGNCTSMHTEGVHFNLHSIGYYDSIKEKGLKYGGIYLMNRPVLVLRDPEYIKDILMKDFDYFTDRSVYYNEKDDPISAHLFAIRGQRWKNLRAKLTPTFTSGKMKTLFPGMVKLCAYLVEAIDVAAIKKDDIDIREFSAKFTTDVICSAAFGLDSNTFKNPDSEFRQMAKKTFEIRTFFQYVSNIIIGKAPDLALKLGLVGCRKDVAEYFYNLVESTIKYRKTNNIQRPDFLQLLDELKESTANTDNPFTFDELVAQVFLFFIAGLDTSSVTMLFTLYELARNPEIQAKTRDDIQKVLQKNNGDITYDSLSEMKYTQQVIEESHRLYPPVPNLNRVCVKDYKLRDSQGTVGKGVTALIPVFSLQRDPEYYPDPEKFDPDRFSPEKKKQLHPCLQLAFGEGQRNCIGSRFGLMQTKIGLIHVLRNFKLTVSPSTKPLEFDKDSFMLSPKNTIYLKAEKL